MASDDTFASGRYLKRKRNQVNYRMPELDVDGSDTEAEAETDEAVVKTDQSDADADVDADAYASHSDPGTDEPDSGSESSEYGSDAEYGSNAVTKVYPIFKKRRQTKTGTQMVPRPLPKSKIFPFLKLPAEVRNMIYGYALSDPTGLNFLATTKDRRRTCYRVSSKAIGMYAARGRRKYSRWNWVPTPVEDARAEALIPEIPPSSMAPQLLTVNKQLYEEAGSFLYSNELVFGDTLALYSFLLHLGPTGVTRLKNILLYNWNDSRSAKAYGNACFALLVPAVDISDFSMETEPQNHRSAEEAARKLYRDAFPWLEAVGRAKQRFDAAIDVIHLDEEMQSISGSASDGEKAEDFKTKLRDLLEARAKWTEHRRGMKRG